MFHFIQLFFLACFYYFIFSFILIFLSVETDVLRMICLSLFYNIIFIHQEPMTVHYTLDTDLSSCKKKHNDSKEPNKDLRFPNTLKVQIYKIKTNFNFNIIISYVCPCRKILNKIYGLSANNNIKLSGAREQRKTKGCIKLL